MRSLVVSRDDPLARAVQCRLIEKGVETVFVEDGREALAILQAGRGDVGNRIDLVVIDGQLASMDSLEFLRLLKDVDR